MSGAESTTARDGAACVVCGHPPAEHEGSGQMVHDFVELDDQCPITSRRCDRPCGTECIRGMFAAPAAEADNAGEVAPYVPGELVRRYAQCDDTCTARVEQMTERGGVL